MNISFSRTSKTLIAVTPVLIWLFAMPQTQAYPQFQEFSEKNSGRNVNCAMCHVNGDGPTGDGKGQIGGLTKEELDSLMKARSALAPGTLVDSPILNKFGNEIIKDIGKRQFLELRQKPKDLAKALPAQSDLDQDGISDGQEYLDGTDPLNPEHGDPLKLLMANLNKYRLHVILTFIAVMTLNWGIMQFLKGLEILTKPRQIPKA